MPRVRTHHGDSIGLFLSRVDLETGCRGYFFKSVGQQGFPLGLPAGKNQRRELVLAQIPAGTVPENLLFMVVRFCPSILPFRFVSGAEIHSLYWFHYSKVMAK